MRVTIKEFAAKIGVDYAVASSLLRFMVQKGQATVVEKISAGKGKPTSVYEVPNKMEVEF